MATFEVGADRRLLGGVDARPRDQRDELGGVVDDDPAIVQLLGEMLKPFGDVRWRAYWYYLRGLTITGR